MIQNILPLFKEGKLTLSVKPNSAKNEIKEWNKEKQILKINIKAPAENNKANIEIIKFFNKLLKKNVKIVSGLSSKKKVLKIV